MTPKSVVLVALLSLALPAGAAAQVDSPYHPEEFTGGDGGTYIKVGLSHWQGDIFSGRSLTQWNGDPFGADYRLTSIGVEVETYFDRPRLLLFSGWAVGYRKDAIGQMDSGHMVHGSAFRTFDLKIFQVRGGGGMEWGVPSLNFDTTEFDYRADGALRYNHTYPVKNVDVPGVGTRKDGVLYPFLEGSLVQRFGPLLVEGGMRLSFVRFQFDTYEVGADDRLVHGFSSRRVLMPMLFLDVGLRAF